MELELSKEDAWNLFGLALLLLLLLLLLRAVEVSHNITSSSPTTIIRRRIVDLVWVVAVAVAVSFRRRRGTILYSIAML